MRNSFAQAEPDPIRLLCDIYNRGNTIDLNTGQPAQFYRGDDIEIDIGIGTNGVLYTNTIVTYSNIVCSVFRSQNDTNPPLMQTVVYATNINTALTAAEWTSDTAPFFHAAFQFTNGASAITLNGNASASYWLRIQAITTNTPVRTLTIEDGPITVFDAPIDTLAPPITGLQSYVVVSNGSLALAAAFTNIFAANSNLLNQSIPASTFSGTALTNYANTLSENNTNFAQAIGTTVTNSFQWGAPTLSNLVQYLPVDALGHITNASLTVSNTGGFTTITSNALILNGTNGGNLTLTPYGLTNLGAGFQPFIIGTATGEEFEFGRLGVFTTPSFSSDAGNFASSGSGNVTIGNLAGGALTITKNTQYALTIQGDAGKEGIHIGVGGTSDAIAIQGTNYQQPGNPLYVATINTGTGDATFSNLRQMWNVISANYSMSLFDHFLYFNGSSSASITLPTKVKSNQGAGIGVPAWVNPYNGTSATNSTDCWIINGSTAGTLTISDTNADAILVAGVSQQQSGTNSLALPPGGWVHCWSDGTNIIANGEHAILGSTYVTIATNGLDLTLAVNTAITNALNAQMGVLSTNATNYAVSIVQNSFNGSPLTNWIGTLSTNATNYALSQATAATSVAETYAAMFSGTLSTNLTNFAGVLSTNATNYALSQGIAATSSAESYAALLGQTLTNWAGILSTNATNWASSLISGSFSGTALTNLIIAAGNNLTNFAGVLSTNATNWAGVLSTNATNFAQGTVGLAATNYTLALGTTISNYAQSGSSVLSNLVAHASVDSSGNLTANSITTTSGSAISLIGNAGMTVAGPLQASSTTALQGAVTISAATVHTNASITDTNNGGYTYIASNYFLMHGTNASGALIDNGGNITNSGNITSAGNITANNITLAQGVSVTGSSSISLFFDPVTIAGQLTASGGAALSGTVTVPLATLIPARLGNSTTLSWGSGFVQSNYLSSSSTYTVNTPTDGQWFTVTVTDSGGNGITWSVPGGQTLKWPGGSAPSQTPNKTDVYTFIKSGNTIYGSAVQNF